MASNPLPESVFRSLVHFAPDAFLVVDRGGTLVFANAQTEALFGYLRDELVGMPIERLVPAHSLANHVELREAYMHAPRARPMGSRQPLTARRRDGSEVPVEISLAPVYADEGMLISVIVRDVSDQREYEDERRRLQAETEIERDRNRIAADLHDGVMQTMYSVGLQLTALLRLTPELSKASQGRINDAIQELDQAIRDVRSYVQDLQPLEFDGDLASSLQDLTSRFSTTSGIEASFNGQADAGLVDPIVALELFLLTREALSNIRRHANASAVAVELDGAGETLSLAIRDDGVGFDAAATPSSEHRGLRNMRNRAQSAGGSLQIHSEPGNGTEVRVRVTNGGTHGGA